MFPVNNPHLARAVLREIRESALCCIEMLHEDPESIQQRNYTAEEMIEAYQEIIKRIDEALEGLET